MLVFALILAVLFILFGVFSGNKNGCKNHRSDNDDEEMDWDLDDLNK